MVFSQKLSLLGRQFEQDLHFQIFELFIDFIFELFIDFILYILFI